MDLSLLATATLAVLAAKKLGRREAGLDPVAAITLPATSRLQTESTR
jgi:hypothetical protein